MARQGSKTCIFKSLGPKSLVLGFKTCISQRYGVKLSGFEPKLAFEQTSELSLAMQILQRHPRKTRNKASFCPARRRSLLLCCTRAGLCPFPASGICFLVKKSAHVLDVLAIFAIEVLALLVHIHLLVQVPGLLLWRLVTFVVHVEIAEGI